MKLFIAEFGHETNTFSSEICDFARFAPNGWKLGEEVISYYRPLHEYLSGMIKVAEEAGAQLIPGIAVSNAGPLVTRECLDTICGKLIEYLTAAKDEIDGVCLALHGAGCAQGADDLEAYTLEQVRAVVGPDMPITVTLDLHGNITPEMARLADGLFGLKEYPHTDGYEAGILAMQTLISMVKGGPKPHTALVQLPLFSPPSMGNTFFGPMKVIRDYVAGRVTEDGLIDASFFHGFPYQDVPHVGSSVVVVADSPQKSEASARAIARHVWSLRETLLPVCLTTDEAVDKAQGILAQPGEGYVVINEASDNPGGGAPCDGTHLLRTLIERQVPKAILGIIYDPEMARLAHQAGVGGKISGRLGAKTDSIHGTPIELVDAEVLNLSNGDFTLVTPAGAGMRGSYGKTARLRIGTVEVVVAEILATQTLDDRPFLITGADINQYDIVAVKSTNHFQGFFRPRAKAVVTADPPGIHTANFAQLTYHRLPRDIYPLQPDTVFEG